MNGAGGVAGVQKECFGKFHKRHETKLDNRPRCVQFSIWLAFAFQMSNHSPERTTKNLPASSFVDVRPVRSKSPDCVQSPLDS